jgi:hypothetical protein
LGKLAVILFPGIGQDGLDNRLNYMRCFGGLTGRRVALIAKAILAVKPSGVLIPTPQWAGAAGVHGNVRTAELGDV